MTKYKHFTFEQRVRLEKLLRSGMSIEGIAYEFGCHRSTIYNQIKAGQVDGMYNAELAQKRYEEAAKEKGPKPILKKNPSLCKYISECILEKKYSPAKIIDEINKGKTEFAADSIRSVNTIYSALDKGLIPDCTRDNLAYANETTINKHGEITIPQRIREALDLKAGEHFLVTIDDDKIIISKINS